MPAAASHRGRAWRPAWTPLTALLLLASLLWSVAWLAAPSGNDLLVYGGTPQGVMAAVAAAQQGQRVVLAVPGDQVGGVLTRAWLTTLDMSSGPDGQPLSRGMVLGLYRALHHDNSFDVGEAQRYFNALLRSPRVRVLTRVPVRAAAVTGGRLGCPLLGGPGHERVVCAARYVDASDGADLAAAAGLPFTLGRADTGQDDTQMAAGLVFRVAGVDWAGLQARLARPPGTGGPGALLPALETLTGRSLVGLADVTRHYVPSNQARFVLRGLNGARQDDGTLLVNALLMLNVDGTSPASVRDAHASAEGEARRVVAFLRASVPEAFGHARYAGAAPELYLRETRHLVGTSRLHADDVFYGRHFPDRVAVGAYPLDGQQYRPAETPFLIGHPAPYEVPYRTLLPRRVGNLLVVSQAASFDSVAAFSARVAPLQMTLGEAAGLASAVASVTHRDYAALSSGPLLAVLQGGLARRGNLLHAPESPQALACRDRSAAGYAQAVALLRRGLMTAPYYYFGCLNLQDRETGTVFLADLQHGLTRTQLAVPERQATLGWLRGYYQDLPDTPVREADVDALLTLLRLPLPGSPGGAGPLTRAQAAQLRARVLSVSAPRLPGLCLPNTGRCSEGR
ncbi:FAD-dependent oxidoreductase [Deinococcus aquiradiocola]|nr:FAD-dependent oxidoreductase [Deinococcus aquiradiocola]